MKPHKKHAWTDISIWPALRHLKTATTDIERIAPYVALWILTN
ncbi:protein of unknown function (plasmid) [Cupriavidus taiwanensis]|nr:protein of unknown function [Cupriavidus taiwanensis]SPA57627.1 protein of unknown function [Cupriavidus taiwanensis]